MSCADIRRAVGLVLTVSLSGLAGCSVFRDPGYNPYANDRARPPLTGRGQQAVDAVGEALDNLDTRLETLLN